MRISEEDIQAIRSRADIAEIISDYIPLVNKGRSLSAVCPFHDDHDPSLSISRDKQIYKCFVCGNAGNVFSFVQNYEKCSFIEAVVKVAEKINYPLDFSAVHFESNVDPRKKHLYKCFEEAIQYMKFQLHATEGVQYLEYLNNRGLNKEILDMFDIGYNGGNYQVTHFLTAKGYQESDLLACGISRLNEFSLKDIFYHRITFPIHDSLGNPIAFSARSIDPNNQSKYINTTETELYIKGDVVYNYHRAKAHAKKAGRIIVCEGVMDVIAFARCNVFNVVATLGTACTKEQIRLLKQCSPNLVFCYDDDTAGRKATIHASKQAMDFGCNVSIIKNHSGLDPDEIINKYGTKELELISNSTVTYIEYVFEELQKQYDLENYSDKKKFANEIYQIIQNLTDDFDRQTFLHKLTLLTGFSASMFSEHRVVVKEKYNNQTKVRLNPLQDGKTNAENAILSQMLLNINASECFKKQLGFLSDNNAQQCAMIIVDYYRKYDVMVVADLLDTCTTQEQKETILKLIDSEQYPSEYQEGYLLGAINTFNRSLLKDKIKDISNQIKTVLNLESKEILINEKIQLQRKLEELKNEE